MIQQNKNSGVFRANEKGFGFINDTAGAGFFVAPLDARRLLTGDLVEFGVSEGPRGLQAVDCQVVSRHATVVGRVRSNEAGHVVFEPEETVLPRLTVPGIGCDLVGKTVCVRVPVTGAFEEMIQGQLDHVVGLPDELGYATRHACAKWDIPAAVPAASVLSSIERRGPQAAMLNLPFVTIDGESSKDFDDAVHACATPIGFELTVAIADVSSAVPAGTEVDAFARERGTTVYFHDRVIPMLPSELADDLCSLRPGVERPVLCVSINFDRAGRILRYEFSRRRIVSAARLTYDQVTAHAEGRTLLQGVAAATVDALLAWHVSVEPARAKRGLLSFDNVEWRVEETAQGGLLHAHSLTLAHRLVEDAMLAANRCAAAQLMLNNEGALYRHHEGVDLADWADSLPWFRDLGLQPPEVPTLGALRGFLADAAGHELWEAIQFRVRRCLKQASYDCRRSSHFTLDFAAYTHFTSPIRRYADLMVHRMLLGEVRDSATDAALAEHLSATSRRATVATRAAADRVKLALARNEVGAGVDAKGQIVAAAAYGVRVQLPQWQVTAIVGKQALLDAGYEFDENRRVWASSAKALWPGLPLDVRVRADEASRGLAAVVA